MGLVRDTPTHHDEHFYQVIWKYNNDFWSYSPDKVGRTDVRMDALTDAYTVANGGDYLPASFSPASPCLGCHVKVELKLN